MHACNAGSALERWSLCSDRLILPGCLSLFSWQPHACRLLLAPIFGHAAPGNLGMASPLLHLPSRATPPPGRPSSFPSPETEAAAATSLQSRSPGIAAGTVPSPRTKQSSLVGFLSPAAAAATQTEGKGANMTNMFGGHSQQFIDESWQQRLHGRQPQQPPPVQPQQAVSKPQQSAKAKQAAGAVTKERGVKRPLDLPTDIDSLLPPEWGGKAEKLDKAKNKGKQKSKMSLTAQYLHPDTLQHPKDSALQNRPEQLSSALTAGAGRSTQPQQQPHTRPNAAAAVAAAHKRQQSQNGHPVQQAQQAQQGSNSNIPWFSSNKAAAPIPEGDAKQQTPIRTTHSFGSWLPTLWGQTPPHANPQADMHAPSSSQQGNARTSDVAALPLSMRPLARNEDRLGQLTAMHHKPSNLQTTINDPSSSHMGSRAPPSRSPSPVLMEDSEFDAELSAIGRCIYCHMC